MLLSSVTKLGKAFTSEALLCLGGKEHENAVEMTTGED